MLLFPQLSTGASTQYPTGKQLSQRSVKSAMEDGTIVTRADSSANYLRWRIQLQDLSDNEATTLTDFFAATQGSLLPFLFLDPTSNLLVWSEDFQQTAWETAGVIFDMNVVDPMGGSRAARGHNRSSAAATVAQESQIPGSVQTCFSIYLRSDVPATVKLTRSAGTRSQSVVAALATTWQRFYISGMFSGVTDSSRFAITVPAGTSLELFGPQTDAQVTPSRYVTSVGRSGIYTNARFDGKQIDVIATGPNRNTCVVLVRCNLPAGE